MPYAEHGADIEERTFRLLEVASSFQITSLCLPHIAFLKIILSLTILKLLMGKTILQILLVLQMYIRLQTSFCQKPSMIPEIKMMLYRLEVMTGALPVQIRILMTNRRDICLWQAITHWQIPIPMPLVFPRVNQHPKVPRIG